MAVVGLALCWAATGAFAGAGGETGAGGGAEAGRRVSRETRVDATRQLNEHNPVNHIAFLFYNKLKKNRDNLIFSPYGLSLSLAAAYDGARGETAAEMKETLGLPGRNETRELFKKLSESMSMPTTGEAVELNVANSIWVDAGLEVFQGFMKVLAIDYNSEVLPAKFKENPAGALKEINGWISQKTHGRIDSVLSNIPENTAMILANAVHFKTSWKHRFHILPEPADFHPAKGVKVRTPMLWNTSPCLYAEEPAGQKSSIQVLELPSGQCEKPAPGVLVTPMAGALPMEEGDTTMLLLLPRRLDGLAQLEATLSADVITRWRRDLRMTNVCVFMPRWKIEQSLTLNQVLRNLGVKQAFDTQHADFRGIAPPQPGRIYLSNVMQKAMVEVGEEDNEAAAATMFPAGHSTCAMSPPVEFRADHPFMYAVIHRHSGTIIFLGRVVNPKIKGPRNP